MLKSCLKQAREEETLGDLLLQPWIPGIPASVALLVGQNCYVCLPPAFQHLSTDGRFHYLGGSLPLPPALAQRASWLAERAVACVPGLRGYVGVDLVLGKTEAADWIIEINPRLTTSYIGLRALAETNLAEALLQTALKNRMPSLVWKNRTARFTAAGQVSVEAFPT